QGRDAFNALAERYYGSRTPEQQRFLRRIGLLDCIDGETAERLVQAGGVKDCLAELQTSDLSLVQSAQDGKVEIHPFFRDFLQEKLLAGEGQEAVLKLHSQIATQ